MNKASFLMQWHYNAIFHTDDDASAIDCDH